jgi:hypothetical protein
MTCDVAGETLLVAEPSAHRLATLLTAGAANGLYTLGGVWLMLRTGGLPRWVRASMWATWAAGAAMTASAVLDSATGLVASTAVLFPLFLAWTAWMARSWGAR